MSQFSNIVADVYTLTNRADLIAETSLAVRNATLKAHRIEKWKRDIQEISVLLPTNTQAVVQLDIPTYFSRWRQFKYIRPTDAITLVPKSVLLTCIEPDGIFDEYLAEKTDVYYVAGNNTNIRGSAAYTGFFVGFYQNPLVTPEGSYSSWIAQDYPMVIILMATITILQSIGYVEAANKLTDILYGPQDPRSGQRDGGEIHSLRMSELEAEGR